MGVTLKHSKKVCRLSSSIFVDIGLPKVKKLSKKGKKAILCFGFGMDYIDYILYFSFVT